MKYVLAVSGGVDSVVLLDKTANDARFRADNFGTALWPDDFMVAHFNHGIRPMTSDRDAQFVGDLAQQYSVSFVLGREQLGPGASEELARERRYYFLQSVAAANQAVIVTAHHQDDLIETVVMNLIRGTGWRGLTPMHGRQIVRPLLGLSKFELINYALAANLNWVEDETNQSMNYFRNRIRFALRNLTKKQRCQMMTLINRQWQYRDQIEAEDISLVGEYFTKTADGYRARRYDLIMMPDSVALELLHVVTDGLLLTNQLKDCLMFVKLAHPGKRLIFGSLTLVVTKVDFNIKLAV